VNQPKRTEYSHLIFHGVKTARFVTNASKPGGSNAVVMKLTNDLGFDTVGAGALDESWHQQPGTPVCGADHDSEGVRRALNEASSQRPPQFQATDVKTTRTGLVKCMRFIVRRQGVLVEVFDHAELALSGRLVKETSSAWADPKTKWSEGCMSLSYVSGSAWD
jgi:hypothetical protein